MKGQETSSVEQASETTVTLNGLIPSTAYTIEIQEATGKAVTGETTLDYTMPQAESFKDYGFTTAYVSTWLRPSNDDWTYRNLGTTRTSFGPGEILAFACETLGNIQSSDDTVTTLLVVRDSDGNVVDHYSGQSVWSDMWSNDMYVGELARMPETAGSYTLEIYFNGKLVETGKAITFTVTG